MPHNTRLPNIKACLFDAYGTLFDVHAAAAATAERIGARWQAFSRHWRERQLQYSWIRSLTGRHVDFWQVTCDALDHALDAFELDAKVHREPLLASYRCLDAYPDARSSVKQLLEANLPCGILSNGSREMLANAIKAAGIDDLIEPVISVEKIGKYKPSPEVYKMATEQLDLLPRQILFISSNGWDAYSAKAFGFNVAWCNRANQPPERLPDRPDWVINSLDELPSLIVA